MGFNLYLAGGDSVPLELKKTDNVGILTTFADGPTAVKKFIDKRHCKTFCDSGAYGAAHSGKTIDLDEYCEFIDNTPECDVFACLDVIPWKMGDGITDQVDVKKYTAEESWKNYKYMIQHVKAENRDKIVPTYHVGEDAKWIETIINGFDGYAPSYMAFGGRAGTSTKDLYRILDETFWPTVKGSKNPNIKVHAFGVTVFKMLEKYPWYSADSTTWLRTGIACNIHTRTDCGYGVLNISDRQERVEQDNHFNHMPKHVKDAIVEEIESRTHHMYGEEKSFTLVDLQNDYKLRHLWNCLYYKDWADNFVYEPPKTIIKRKSLCRSRK